MIPSLLLFLITQAFAQNQPPYCADGRWASKNSFFPLDMGGIKLLAYNEHTLHVKGVFSNSDGTIQSMKLVSTGSTPSTEVLDFSEAIVKGVTTGVFSKTYDLTNTSIYSDSFLKHIQSLPKIFHYPPSFFLLNFLDTSYEVVGSTQA